MGIVGKAKGSNYERPGEYLPAIREWEKISWNPMGLHRMP